MKVWNTLCIPDEWNHDFVGESMKQLADSFNTDDPYQPSLKQLKQDLDSAFFPGAKSTPLKKIQFFATIANEIIGFCQCRTLFEEFELDFISVKKNWRGQGVSRRLMEEMILYCKRNSYKKFRLEVGNDNIMALSLYEKFHLKQVGIRKSYYPNGKDALIMEREFE